jgi:hypothetical protein
MNLTFILVVLLNGGNPFEIGIDGTREEVIEKYRNYLLNNKELFNSCKKELKGKILGCWCSPKCCHGDVLAEIANNPFEEMFDV